MKKFSWRGRYHAAETTGLDMTKMDGRTKEVKRRKTMDDYEMVNRSHEQDITSK